MIISTQNHVYAFEWREKMRVKRMSPYRVRREHKGTGSSLIELFLNFIYLVVPGLSYIHRLLWSSLQHAGI